MTISEHPGFPWNVPKSWRWAAIGDIAETASGDTPRRDVPGFFGGGTPWLKSSELRDGIIWRTAETVTKAGLASCRARLCPKGTICIARFGTIAGRLGILGLEAATNEAVCTILPSKELLPKYLFRFLELQRPVLIAPKSGVAQAHINLSNLRAMLIPVPPPAEQRRISAEIDIRRASVDSGMLELKRTFARLNRYRYDVLTAAFQGRLVAAGLPLEQDQDRSRDSIGFGDATGSRTQRTSRPGCFTPVSPKTRRRSGIPEGWKWATAKQLCAEITSGWNIQTLYEPKGQPLVRAKNVSDGVVDFKGCGLVSDVLFEGYSRRCSPQKNDILIAGGGLNIGRAAVVESDSTFAIANNVLLMRPNLETRFLLHWVRSPYCQNWIRRVAGSTARARLFLSNARRMPVLHPPRDEQRRIVQEIDSRFSATNRLEDAIRNLQKRADALRTEILNQAFQGNLKVSSASKATKRAHHISEIPA